MSNLDATSTNRTARYRLIAEHLRQLVANADPGDRLPSEAELCEQFAVSRMTARQAVQLLSSEGLIERRRGAGTFVRAHPVRRDLGSPLSFSVSMKDQGMTASSKTLRWGPVQPDKDERRALELGDADDAYVLERLRLADNLPMALERVVMPGKLAAALGSDFQDGSLHDAFRQIGRLPTEAHAEISARKATKRERQLLELPPSEIIISERRTIYDQDQTPLERTATRYVASRYSFRAILRPEADR